MKHQRMLQSLIDRSFHRDRLKNQVEERSVGSTVDPNPNKMETSILQKLQKNFQG